MDTWDEDNIVGLTWEILKDEAERIAKQEPLLRSMAENLVLSRKGFDDALTHLVIQRIGVSIDDQHGWMKLLEDVYSSSTLGSIGLSDLTSIKARDPACESYFSGFVNFKGFISIQLYRLAHELWGTGRRELALYIQGLSAKHFAVDIHPAAVIGPGFMLDHATGVVIGETAVIGKNCTFLHGITLGATGKQSGDRHPKIGDNVFIGCNVMVLGNITIGNGSKIGAGSIVLKSIPAGATAVGNPARILPAPASSPSTISDSVIGNSKQECQDGKQHGSQNTCFAQSLCLQVCQSICTEKSKDSRTQRLAHLSSLSVLLITLCLVLTNTIGTGLRLTS